MLIKKSVAHWSSKFSFGDVIYMQGFLMCLKHPDVADLSTTNISNFSPVTLAAAIPMSLTLLFFYLRSTSHLINGWFYREDTGKRVHICQQ